MNEDILKGNWTKLRGKIQKQWSHLTKDDVTAIDGDKKVLLGMLQEKYGITKEEAKDELSNFYKLISEEAESIKEGTLSTLKNSTESVQNFVRNSPLKAVGIAAVTGLLIGLRF